MGFTEHTQLTNLRFAGDILLVSSTLRQLKAMLRDIKCAAAKVGLELHPDNTKILSNATRGTGIPKEPMVGFDRSHDVEINNRIRSPWKRFMQHRAELTDRSYPLNSRLRLFDSTVTATMLYGSATWVLTCELEDNIRRTQRQMLRMIIRMPRRREHRQPTTSSASSSSSSSSSSS
eukprot:4153800-Pyramimonas_sp.AAC.1